MNIIFKLNKRHLKIFCIVFCWDIYKNEKYCIKCKKISDLYYEKYYCDNNATQQFYSKHFPVHFIITSIHNSFCLLFYTFLGVFYDTSNIMYVSIIMFVNFQVVLFFFLFLQKRHFKIKYMHLDYCYSHAFLSYNNFILGNMRHVFNTHFAQQRYGS